ncbi:MAG: hypothetical protein M3367_10785 [Acidobacteriota bacterium]|nr:hypothetical protein [Acidobacteriota bacterium]
MLIRLEDSKGQLIRNIYGAPNYTIGINETGLSAEERKSLLKSNDTAETLASLMWLSGKHLNPNKLQNYSAKYDENIAEAKLANETRSLSEVKATLQKLKNSNNYWLQNAANLALDVEYYD